jgi:hypothetical protein
VTFDLRTGDREHVYYQINNGRLVADYVLAVHGWRASYWINFPELRQTTEDEALNFVEFWRDEGRLDNPPRAT